MATTRPSRVVGYMSPYLVVSRWGFQGSGFRVQGSGYRVPRSLLFRVVGFGLGVSPVTCKVTWVILHGVVSPEQSHPHHPTRGCVPRVKLWC